MPELGPAQPQLVPSISLVLLILIDNNALLANSSPKKMYASLLLKKRETHLCIKDPNSKVDHFQALIDVFVGKRTKRLPKIDDHDQRFYFLPIGIVS